MSSVSSELICVVCQQKTSLFNYGVPSCNACITFFRRALISPRKKYCKNNQLCLSGPNQNPKCRFCRFEQCIKSGMAANLSLELRVANDPLSVAIRELTKLDDHRDELLFGYHISDNLKFGSATEKSIKFIKRPANLKYTSFEWGFLEQLTTIDFLKKLDIMESIDKGPPTDKQIFIMSSFFSMGFFRISMMCYQKKLEVTCFPDGTDLFPAGIEQNPRYSGALLNKIRCELVGRLAELKVTRDEFLLLSLVFLCDFGLPNLSDSARTHISNYQKLYSSHLLQHCLITYPNHGPSRFTDLLSLCHVISRSILQISSIVALSNLPGNRNKLDDYFEDLLNFLTI